MSNPASRYATPEAVLEADLSTAEKIEILRRWEYDQREQAVAMEEGMGQKEPELLDRIVRARRQLGDDGGHDEGAPPTKTGG